MVGMLRDLAAYFFFFQAEDGIRDDLVTGVQTCALPICRCCLGGVCLNVGCIPSKALLHVAAVVDEVKHLEVAGVKFGAPEVNIDQLRGHKDKVIGKLTGGLGRSEERRVGKECRSRWSPY